MKIRKEQIKDITPFNVINRAYDQKHTSSGAGYATIFDSTLPYLSISDGDIGNSYRLVINGNMAISAGLISQNMRILLNSTYFVLPLSGMPVSQTSDIFIDLNIDFINGISTSRGFIVTGYGLGVYTSSTKIFAITEKSIKTVDVSGGFGFDIQFYGTGLTDSFECYKLQLTRLNSTTLNPDNYSDDLLG